MNKIFGIGCHKTGTSSLSRALNILGIKSSHWSHHTELFNGILKNKFKFKLLEEYDAVTDFPIPVIYKELDKEYPKSKFILTVRDPEDWFKSVLNYIRKRCLSPEEALFYGANKINKKIFLKKFLAHNKQVLNYFKNRPNDLLVINICEGEGWKKLCGFLDKNIPSKSYPHVNKGTYSN